MDIKGIYQAQQNLIKGIDGIVPRENQVKPESPAAGGKTSFSDFLSQQLSEVNSESLNAEKAIQRSISGEDANPHDVLIALQKADISFKLLMSVKERLTQAYQEIMRMPIG